MEAMTAPSPDKPPVRLMAANQSHECVGHNGHAYIHAEIFYYGSVCERYVCTEADPLSAEVIAWLAQKGRKG